MAGPAADERNGRTLLLPISFEPGVSTPSAVSIFQFGKAERTTKSDFCTALLSPQNGHVPVSRASIEVMSMSFDLPVHALGSLFGSAPANENSQVPAARSTFTKRS